MNKAGDPISVIRFAARILLREGCENRYMPFTPIHRELGLEPSDLTFDILQDAVTAGVTEQTDLDWKESRPDSRNQSAKEEFAKDIAAMVNSGGGMIVFGVREDERSAASELVGVPPWTDGEERRLRQIAYALIQPPVQNITFTPMSDGSTTIVALAIPASQEVPHFQLRQGMFRAPRRYGAQTMDMSERDIEGAYRSRFDDRMARERSLEVLASDVVLGLPTDSRVWMAAAAIPTAPRPSLLGRLPHSAAEDVINGMRKNPYLAPGNENYFSATDPNLRTGFRRWRSVLSFGRNRAGAIDIHDDGSVALAYADLGARDMEAGTDVHPMNAHHFPAYAVRLVQAAAARLDVSSGYEVQLTMQGAEAPLYIRRYDRGFLVDRADSVPIHRLHPVRSLIEGVSDEQNLNRHVHSLVLDIRNQAGINFVDPTYIRETQVAQG